MGFQLYAVEKVGVIRMLDIRQAIVASSCLSIWGTESKESFRFYIDKIIIFVQTTALQFAEKCHWVANYYINVIL